MGASVGKSVDIEDEYASDFLAEPMVEEKVDFVEPGYPKPCPPPKKKENIFKKEDYTYIDERARNASDNVSDSFDTLIEYLTRDLKNDLQKLRAIFIWFGHQNIHDRKYNGNQTTTTPKGFMRGIKEKKGRYATLFAVLCRKAKIPCAIIKGNAKSIKYQVGMTELECQKLTNYWNAVYVEDGWRFIFPLWAYRALVGHSLGDVSLVEDKGKPVRQSKRASTGRVVTRLNEYYFLTNPEDFIFNCFPNEEEWQLLKTPWEFKQFVEVPYCTSTFFEQKVKFASNQKCVLDTIDGECTVTIQSMKNMYFDSKLYYNKTESSTRMKPTLQLEGYVFVTHNESVIRFQARMPKEGVYRLHIVGGNTVESSLSLCIFKIVCNEAKHKCQQLPIKTLIGYGPSEELGKVGIKAKSHKKGVVKLMPRTDLEMTFETQKEIPVDVKLVHNTMKETDLKKCISVMVTRTNITIKVSVKEDGEYALQMFAKPAGPDTDDINVCNYLLTYEIGPKRIRKYENAAEKKTRSRMIELAQSQKDLVSLKNEIERFEKYGLNDKGHLSFARDALDIGRLEKDLKEAINRRRIECLEKAITHASESKFRDHLHFLLYKAKEMHYDLNKLGGYAHAVLELIPSTIAELRSYKPPPKVLHDVMIATFLLLGEKKEDLQCWEAIQQLLSNPQGLLLKVKQFNPMNDVGAETYAYVMSILQAHTLDSARTISAGAGTFYVWAKKISEEMSNRFASTA